MSGENWTPGPWFVAPEPDENGLATIDDGLHFGMSPIRCEWTEAHVVQAAPEMYAVLKEYVEACKAQGINLGPITGDAEYVLSKARGEDT